MKSLTLHQQGCRRAVLNSPIMNRPD